MDRRSFIKKALATAACFALPGSLSGNVQASEWTQVRILRTGSDITDFFMDKGVWCMYPTPPKLEVEMTAYTTRVKLPVNSGPEIRDSYVTGIMNGPQSVIDLTGDFDLRFEVENDQHS